MSDVQHESASLDPQPKESVRHWFTREILEESYAREKALQRAARVWDVRVYTVIGMADMLVVLWMLSRGNWLGAATLGLMVSACVVAVRRAKAWLRKADEPTASTPETTAS